MGASARRVEGDGADAECLCPSVLATGGRRESLVQEGLTA